MNVSERAESTVEAMTTDGRKSTPKRLRCVALGLAVAAAASVAGAGPAHADVNTNGAPAAPAR